MSAFMGNIYKQKVEENGAFIGYVTCPITVQNISVDAESETPTATVDLSGIIDIYVYSNGEFTKTASIPVTASGITLKSGSNT